jgi:hypothetical protein
MRHKRLFNEATQRGAERLLERPPVEERTTQGSQKSCEEISTDARLPIAP